MKKTKKLSVLLPLVLIFVSCNQKEIKTYDSLENMITEAKKSVEMINAEDLKKEIETENEFYIIDVREHTKYDSASIPEAINIPRGLVEFQISEKAHDHRAPVYVFCDDEAKAILVADMLPELKYSNVKVLKKGFKNWKEKYPDMVELEPSGSDQKASTPPPGSGGCGG